MAHAYDQMTTDERAAELAQVEAEAAAIKARGLALDMARGKPSPQQVALSKPLLDELTSASDLVDGTEDASNYGVPDGLTSARKFMAELLGVSWENVVVGGSSSLEIMNDVLHHCWIQGVCGNTPWSKLEQVKFLCPSPGYDRHFAATAYLGIENIPVNMTETGPDMEQVRALVEGDPNVKGIWLVPKYQNPTGITFSDECVRALAALKPAAPDFRIFWDNAYIVHDLTSEPDELLELFGALEAAGNPNMAYEFASTAKITFPGGGIACVTASAENMADLRRSIAIQRVCANKLVQLAHVRWLRDREGVLAHMRAQAEVLRPRFETVERCLTERLGGLGIASWTHPKGGYFVSFEAPEGCAKAIVAECKAMGVVLTGAGATWPYGNDPHDSNIRIAPSYPSCEQLEEAIEVLACATKLVTLRKLLA